LSREPYYDHAEQAATALLLRQRLYSLRVDPLRLTHDKPIRFDTFDHYCALTRMTMKELSASKDTVDGLTLSLDGGGESCHIVLYHREMECRPRLRFTLAHELGHIYLCHREDGEREEREANRFAAALLIPRVLAALMQRQRGGFLSADELAAAFGTSRTVAELRLRSLRTPVEPSAADLALLEKLRGFLPDWEGPVITV
jgi:hypothetical protein